MSLEKAFPRVEGRAETKLMFREMQHTKMVDSVPPPRVQGLKNLQSLIMKDRLEEDNRWSLDPLARLLLGQEHYYRGESPFSQTASYSESADNQPLDSLYYVDSIHPIQLPAGKIWADIMLHKLMQLST